MSDDLSALIIRPTAQILIATPAGTGWLDRRSSEAVSPAAISLLVETNSLCSRDEATETSSLWTPPTCGFSKSIRFGIIEFFVPAFD